MKVDNVFNIGDCVCYISENQLKEGIVTSISINITSLGNDIITDIEYGIYCSNYDGTIVIEQDNLAFAPITDAKEV